MDDDVGTQTFIETYFDENIRDEKQPTATQAHNLLQCNRSKFTD